LTKVPGASASDTLDELSKTTDVEVFSLEHTTLNRHHFEPIIG